MLTELLESRGLSPEDSTIINIPESGFWGQEAETIETQCKYLEGDLSPVESDSPYAAVRFELSELSEDHPEYLKEIAEKGARIFVTEQDDWFIVHSEESLKVAEAVRSSQD